MNLFVRRLAKPALLPSRSSLRYSYDLFSPQHLLLPARGRAELSLGISLIIPHGVCGHVVPPPELATRYGIQIDAGVIDNDCRGGLYILLFNHGNIDYDIKQGDLIARLVLHPAATPSVIEVLSGTSTCDGRTTSDIENQECLPLD
jgi:dUTP pyrophosphatase